MHRFISIISAIWSTKNGYLFIDEIENGIHYTKYQLLWELIYKNAKNANTQVFITTHSKECIEAFNAVNDNSGILIELYKNRKNQLTSKIRNKEQLEYSLTHQGKFRGE